MAVATSDCADCAEEDAITVFDEEASDGEEERGGDFACCSDDEDFDDAAAVTATTDDTAGWIGVTEDACGGRCELLDVTTDADDATEATEEGETIVADERDDSAVREEDLEGSHETIFHLHAVPHTLPHADAEEAEEPGKTSHSSPTIRDTTPSPQRTFVHDVVQFGPTPLRVLSSHSSP